MERQRWHIILIAIVHIVVYFVVNTAIMLQTRGYENDYSMNYVNAVKNFLDDPTRLYESPDDRMRLRALPALVLYYSIFELISPTTMGGYLVCITWMLLWNLCAVVVIEKITLLDGFRSIETKSFLKDPRVLSLLYLCFTWHSGEYYSGQPNIVAGFFVLLGLYYVMQSKEHLGYLAWGVSTTFKLFPVFLILFFLLRSKKRDLLRNLLCLTVSMIPNLLMFAFYPTLLVSFVSENVSTSLATTFSIFPSGSLARLLTIILPVPFLATSLAVLVVTLPIVLIVYLRHGKNMNLLDQAVLAFTCGIVVFPDFYPGHSVIFWGVFLLWLASRNERIDGTVKLIYFVVFFYIMPSILNPLYAIPFAIMLVCILVMIGRPGLVHEERLSRWGLPGWRYLAPVYLCSAVDIALIFTYLAALG